ncbi:MAG: SsrA-binding protein SmpB [bacterium]|nr:SsrA-binding protein SmpB [bacterium]
MVLVVNKKATFEYTIGKTFEAGLVLTGAEVKSLRLKHGSLAGSFVRVIGSGVFLINAQITPYASADNREYDPRRTRKLLLRKKEISQLAESSQQKGSTIVPMNISIKGRYIKIKVGIGKGKKQFEKRAVSKERSIQRDIQRDLKEKVKFR